MRPTYQPFFSVPATVALGVLLAVAMMPALIEPHVALAGLVMASLGGVLGLNKHFGNPVWQRVGATTAARVRAHAPNTPPTPPNLRVEPVALTFAGLMAVCFVVAAALDSAGKDTGFLVVAVAALVLMSGLFLWQAGKVVGTAAIHGIQAKVWRFSKERQAPLITLHALGVASQRSDRANAAGLVLFLLGALLTALGLIFA